MPFKTELSSMFDKIKHPAPIIDFFPIVILSRIVLFTPKKHCSSTVTLPDITTQEAIKQ